MSDDDDQQSVSRKRSSLVHSSSSSEEQGSASKRRKVSIKEDDVDQDPDSDPSHHEKQEKQENYRGLPVIPGPRPPSSPAPSQSSFFSPLTPPQPAPAQEPRNPPSHLVNPEAQRKEQEKNPNHELETKEQLLKSNGKEGLYENTVEARNKWIQMYIIKPLNDSIQNRLGNINQLTDENSIRSCLLRGTTDFRPANLDKQLHNRLTLWHSCFDIGSDYNAQLIKDLDDSSPLFTTRVLTNLVHLLFADIKESAEVFAQCLRFKRSLSQLRTLINKFSKDPNFRTWGRIADTCDNNLQSALMHWITLHDFRNNGVEHRKNYINAWHTQLDQATALQQQNQEDLENMSEFPRLIQTLCNLAKKKHFIRSEGRVYERVLNPHGQFTRSYQLWKEGSGFNDGDLYRWILNAPYLDGPRDVALWNQVLQRGNLAQNAATILLHMPNPDFPILHMDRFKHAFKNGIYQLDTDEFLPYGSPAERDLPDHTFCCNYYDVLFEDASYRWKMEQAEFKNLVNKTNIPPWMAIETPILDTIPNTQHRWDSEVRQWWYASGGRMLYPAGMFEEWQRMFLHIGKAGSGKTSTIKIWMEFVPQNKQGILNNKCEEVFGIQGLQETWAWFGLDIREDWSINQTVWNTMVDNGPISIARKFKSPVMTKFLQHGVIATNRMLQWPDINGSLKRRLFPFSYDVLPCDINATLMKDIRVEHGRILKKCNCGYLDKCKLTAKVPLSKTTLPKMTAEILDRIVGEVNPIQAFFEHKNWCERGEHFFSDQTDLIDNIQVFTSIMKRSKENVLADQVLMSEAIDQYCDLETDITKLPHYEIWKNWPVAKRLKGPFYVKIKLIHPSNQKFQRASWKLFKDLEVAMDPHRQAAAHDNNNNERLPSSSLFQPGSQQQ
jgi:hypothetical protein